MIKRLTGADSVAYRCWSTSWQVLLKQLTGTDEVVDQALNDQQSRKWSSGWQVLIKSLTDVDLAADNRWSCGWQALIKRLKCADKVVDRCWSSGWLSLIKRVTVLLNRTFGGILPGCQFRNCLGKGRGKWGKKLQRNAIAPQVKPKPKNSRLFRNIFYLFISFFLYWKFRGGHSHICFVH